MKSIKRSKILIPKPINIDVDIDRLKKTLYNNDIHYDSITYDGYMTTIFTNAIPMSIFNLIKTKFTFMDYTNLTKKGQTLWQK